MEPNRFADVSLAASGGTAVGVHIFGVSLPDWYAALGITILLVQAGVWIYNKLRKKGGT